MLCTMFAVDWGQSAVTLLTLIISSGLIQWYFQRKDKKKEDAKKDNADSIKKEMKDHLTDVNNKWKEDYCDKNAKLIEELAITIKEGLEQRENKGFERYEEHKKTIEALRKAVLTLTDDAKERKKSEQSMGASLMALTHDKLIFLGKCYQRRGAITLAEKNNLKMLFEPYHDGLGGNSDGEGYYEYCMSLPVVTDEEAQEMDKKNKEELLRQLSNAN